MATKKNTERKIYKYIFNSAQLILGMMKLGTRKPTGDNEIRYTTT